MKYKAYIIKRENAHISLETGEVVTPTNHQVMLDSFTDRKYQFIQLFSKVAEIEANTLNDLNGEAWVAAAKNGCAYDFEVFIYNRKNKK